MTISTANLSAKILSLCSTHKILIRIKQHQTQFPQKNVKKGVKKEHLCKLPSHESKETLKALKLNSEVCTKT